MDILTTQGFEDYELIDSGEGRRLERFGQFTLDRPDPQVIWKKGDPLLWDKVSATFERTSGDNGKWTQNIPIPEKWQISYKNLIFWVKLTPFKHTGLFPEQEIQWALLEEKILNSKRDIELNLNIASNINYISICNSVSRVSEIQVCEFNNQLIDNALQKIQ